MIVLDTSILSLAFRRRTGSRPAAARLAALIADDAQLAVPGIVAQELLSGLKTAAAFQQLDEILGGFPLLLADRTTHVRAAEVHNRCRAAGVTASTIDCLIAAHTLLIDADLLTLDSDFRAISRHTGLKLHEYGPTR